MITEESGIAKGIRRIVAVTGYEAADVTRAAQVLTEKLDALDAAKGKAKDTGLKAFTVVRALSLSFTCGTRLILVQELSQADISVIRKAQLKDRLAAIRKAHDKQIKDRETQANKNVSSLVLLLGGRG